MMSSAFGRRHLEMIQYPVSAAQEPEGEPNAETILVIRDAAGRTLDVEEIVTALNDVVGKVNVRRDVAEGAWEAIDDLLCDVTPDIGWLSKIKKELGAAIWPAVV
jgi:hypothetical protein